VSDEDLRRAQDFVLRILKERGRAMSPHELLETAATERERPSAELIRLALWGLLAAKVVAQLDDNSLEIRRGQPMEPVRVGKSAV
jgi:hypothetical protein